MVNIDLDNLNEKNIKLLNKIYLDKKKIYAKYLGKFINDQDELVGMSPIFSRNLDTSLTYYYFCILNLLKKINKTNKKINIYTSRYILFKFLKKNFLKKNDIHIIYKGGLKNIFCFFLKGIFNLKKFFLLIYFIFIQLICKIRLSKFSYQTKKKFILVDTTILESCFIKNKFVDRFYGNYIKKFKKKIVLTEENLLFSKSLKYLNSNIVLNSNFLFKFHILNFFDYLYSLKKVSFIDIKNLKKNIYLENVNLNILIKNDLSNSFCDFNYFYGIINYMYFYNLKKKNFRFKKIINWNENQPADKGFVLGVKSFFPKTRLIGYSSSFNNFDFFFDRQPLFEEVKKKYIPSEMYLPTKKYFKFFNKYSKNSISLKEGPLYRFEKLKRIKIKPNKRLKNILILLPIEFDEVKNIVRYIQSIPENYKITIKFHPNFTNKEKKLFYQKFRNLSFTNDTFDNLINKSDIVISNSSSTTIEAIFYGKQVICPVNDLKLISTPVINFFDKKYYKVAYSPDDMPKIFKNIKNFSKNEITYIENLRKNLFKERKNKHL